MTKKKAAGWIICFALMLLGPGMAYPLVKPYLNTVSTENRTLAEKPEFVVPKDGTLAEGIKAYTSAYNSYYNDHLAFRSQMIGLNSRINVELFRDSASDKVVLGKENWLFYADEGSIDDYKGTNPYTQEELELILENMICTRDYLAERGIEFVLFIPSNKEDIYSHYLPDYISKRDENTKASVLVEYLRQAGIRVVYPRQEMLAYRDQYDLYWHYDTHWNSLGGYIGAKALLSELGIHIPEVEQLSIVQNERSNYDLAGMMNLTDYYMKNMPPDVNYDVSGYERHNMQVLQEVDATQLIYRSDAPDSRRLFMVRDSFAGAMAHILASNFAYTYMPHWNGGFDPAQIGEQQPDIFVYELVERRLDALLTFRLSEG